MSGFGMKSGEEFVLRPPGFPSGSSSGFAWPGDWPLNRNIILGDEATSALDPISTKKIEELFVKLKEKYTVILVTHTLRQAKRIADYIVFMYLGKIIEAGPTEEFFNNPKKQLTKDYLSGSFS